MAKDTLSDIIDFYFRRFGFKPPLIHTPLHPDTKVIVVIPCHDEPNLLLTLNSLLQGYLPSFPVEVIVVINQGTHAPQEVTERNVQTLDIALEWQQSHMVPHLSFQFLYIDDLPKKHAGVGLARKIGMDEALRRFASIQYSGLILCLDADCTVQANYLKEIEEQFILHTPHACNIYFEHPLDSIDDPGLREGILYYELYLRYYVNALAYSGFPYAMHTIGSSMAVRADIYAKTGGMNRRKAGEDFYFLHKIAPLKKLLHIQNTTVYPSARISHRVPFGTGRAQANWLEDQEAARNTYHFQIFLDLRQFLQAVPTFYAIEDTELQLMLENMPDSIKTFLESVDGRSKIQEISQSTASCEAFIKRFFLWMDGFLVLKYVHFARDHFYPQQPLKDAAYQLYAIIKKNSSEDIHELLNGYRLLDKEKKQLV